jgi:hypothetical protein
MKRILPCCGALCRRSGENNWACPFKSGIRFGSKQSAPRGVDVRSSLGLSANAPPATKVGERATRLLEKDSDSAERMCKSIVAGVFASLLLVPPAFAPPAFADEGMASVSAKMSAGKCLGDDTGGSPCLGGGTPWRRGLVLASKTAADVDSLQSASVGDKASAAPELGEDRELCARARRPVIAHSKAKAEHDIRVCPSVGTELDESPEPLPESLQVDSYLCGVYWRMPRKIDDAGDFSWKDRAAAARVKRTVCEYAIQGMHRDLREELFALGTKADEAGINWSFLSAFRDDYRQSIAEGFKARSCQSLHGGSCRTNGWGDGQAADLWVANENGEPADDAAGLFELIKRVGHLLGLSRPLPRADPPHVQVGGDWKGIGQQLRRQRLGIASASIDQRPAEKVSRPAVDSNLRGSIGGVALPTWTIPPPALVPRSAGSNLCVGLHASNATSLF